MTSWAERGILPPRPEPHPLSGKGRLNGAGDKTYVEPVNSAKCGFGQEVRELRKKHNWSQAELGRRSGVSHGFISRVESGERDAKKETVAALADAFGLSGITRLLFFSEAGMIEKKLALKEAVMLFQLQNNR